MCLILLQFGKRQQKKMVILLVEGWFVFVLFGVSDERILLFDIEGGYGRVTFAANERKTAFNLSLTVPPHLVDLLFN